MLIEIDVKDCRSCVFAKDHRGHGECWKYCSHKDALEGSYPILWGCQRDFEKVPTWCPLKLGEK